MIEFLKPFHWVQKLISASFKNVINKKVCPVGWRCRIHRLHHCRRVRPPPAISNALSPNIRHLKPDPLSCIRSNLKIDGVSIVSIFQWKIVHRNSRFSFVNDDAYICFAYFCCWPSQLELQNILTASLQRGKTPPPNEFPWYDTKQSDGEVPVMLEIWWMRSTPSLPLLPGPLWPGMVAPDRALSMG